MKKVVWRALRLVCALLLAALLSGCVSNMIKENETYEALPQIDPEDGVARETEASLFFRLGDEPCLLQVKRTVQIRANERAEMAVMRSLLAGPSSFYGNLDTPFPEGTRMVSLSLDGGILYVTMNRAFLDPMPGAKTREEIDLARRLSVYAIVNSLMSVGNADSVLLLVDLTGSGVGTRVQRAMLGLSSSETTDSQLVEPMRFDGTVVADAGKIVGYALEHIRQREYEQAYTYLAENEGGALQKPDYAQFETDLSTLGDLEEYKVNSFAMAEDGLSAEAQVDLVFRYSEDGVQKKATNATVKLQWEGEMLKIGYTSLWMLLQR
ncbi:MAG: GerMN domain-containing protein [Bacillota bacterium]